MRAVLMGWSFRKSVKILPGVRLNLSKRGVGVSAGVRGFRVSSGPRGTELNAGVGPLRYRSQLGQTNGVRAAGHAVAYGCAAVLILIVVAVVVVAVWVKLRH